MEKTNIYGFEVAYDTSSESAEKALVFLDEIGESGARALFDEARRDTTNHTCHFEVHSHSSDKEYHLTLKYEGNNIYHLRKTTGY